MMSTEITSKNQIVLLCSLLLLLAGCTPNHVYKFYSKNYTTGMIQTKNIGEPIIKVHDYYCNTDELQKSVEAQDDIQITARYKRLGVFDGLAEIKLIKHKVYDVTYVINDENIEYNVIFPSDTRGAALIGVMIDNKGNILTSKYYMSGRVIDGSGTFKVSQFSNKFKVPEEKTCNPDKLRGVTSYELLYSGVNNITMTLTYREFASIGYMELARPDFYQNLVYQTDAKQIRYKNFKIDIVDIDNEKITFKVIEDGLVSEKVPYDDPIFYAVRFRR